jgi:hypothetical protein
MIRAQGEAIMRFLLLGRVAGSSIDAQQPNRHRAVRWLVVVAVVGVVARMAAATQGHNYDIDSYWIVSGHVDAGENVYASTHRYNYGPAWFLVLGALRQVADLFGDPFAAQRYLVAGLLTLVDLWIAWMLLRRFGPWTAVLFVLNPVVILITGYHSQFDNLAIAAGLGGMLLLERGDRAADRRIGRWWWAAGVLVLGLSLVIKHLLVVLPLWLAMRQRTLVRSVLVAVVPPAILVASFLPFVADGGAGIAANVIEYRSAQNAPFHTWLVPGLVQRHVDEVMLFGGGLLVLGWLWRRRTPVERLLLYSVAVVVLSPGMYNQYLAIPAAAIAVFASVAYLVYVGTATLYLVADGSNLANLTVRELLPGFLVRAEMGALPYAYLITLLAIGLAITSVELYRDQRHHERSS